MFRATIILSLAALTLIIATPDANAEDRWSWELRSGADFGSTSVGDTDLGTGAGFEFGLAYRFQPHLAAYTGWGWHHLGADDVLADGSLEQTGYTFGLHFQHPVGRGPFDLYLRGGAVLRHFELEAGDDIVDDSGHGWGWELGGGVDYALGQAWSLRAGLTHRALERDLTVGGVERSVDLGGLAVELGMARTF